MKPFLLRTMDEAAHGEVEVFPEHGDLKPMEVVRERLEKQSIKGISPYDFTGIIMRGGPGSISDARHSKPKYE